ncbi:MAG: fructokinase [Solirubrobacteraceae bacterium]|nr:fructokinase [Solirubrobacteraceae bacterium]
MPVEGGFATHLGGGPFTTARTLARLGRPAWFAGALSTDGLGARLRAALVADGVRLDTVALVDAPTTLALADVDAEGVARYRFYVEGTSAPMFESATLPNGTAALHVGTLGLVLEPMASVIEDLVITAPLDTLVMVDPNCRPDLIGDRAAYRARLDRVLARADLVKASVEDLAYLEPDARPAEAARRLGLPAVVTAGAEGALVVTREDAVSVPARRVRVVDTIGAGDSFGGGLLAWWTERGLGHTALGETAALVEAAAFGVKVSAHVVARAGAVPPLRSQVG